MTFKFCNWDWRPAVLVKEDWTAFAVLKPRGPWVSVDREDVFHTAGVMSEEGWRARFEPDFGPLDLTSVPQASPMADKAASGELSSPRR